MRLQGSQDLVKKNVLILQETGPRYCIFLQVGSITLQFCDSNSPTVTLPISESKTNKYQIFSDLDGCSQQPKGSLISCLPCILTLLPCLASSCEASAVTRTSYSTHRLSPWSQKAANFTSMLYRNRILSKAMAFCFDLFVSVVRVNSVQRILLEHTKHSVEDTQNLSQRKVGCP